jgi:hypothetical protein
MLRSTIAFGVQKKDAMKTVITQSRNMMAQLEKLFNSEEFLWERALELVFLVIQQIGRGLEGKPRRFLV